METRSDDVMNYRTLSVYMKLAEGTLRRKVMRGEIPFYKIGGAVRFSRKQIDLWLAEHHRKPKGAQAGNDGEKTGAEND